MKEKKSDLSNLNHDIVGVPSKQAKCDTLPRAHSNPKPILRIIYQVYRNYAMPIIGSFQHVLSLACPPLLFRVQQYTAQQFCSLGNLYHVYNTSKIVEQTPSITYGRSGVTRHSKVLNLKKTLTKNRSSSMTRSASLDIPRKKSLEAETLFCASWNLRTCTHTTKKKKKTRRDQKKGFEGIRTHITHTTPVRFSIDRCTQTSCCTTVSSGDSDRNSRAHNILRRAC